MAAHLFVPKGSRKGLPDEILKAFAKKRSDSASRDAVRAFKDRDVERKKIAKAMAVEDATFVSDEHGLEPPFPPEALAMVFEHSSALRPCIDAYVANCDGTGHRFSPLLDLESDDAEQRVSDAILIERSLTDASPTPPTPEEVNARIEDLRVAMKVEEHRLDSFFQFLCYDISFIALRRRTRTDLETTGNAYWELNRGDDGTIATAEHVPSITMRLGRLDTEEVEVKQRVMKGPLTWGERTVKRRFRRYIQRVGAKRVWFKELGDPRSMSRVTGKFYATPELLKKTEPKAQPATEILHFSVWSPRSPYGIPRWIGALVSILGARHAEEVNFFYFDNKSVPPLAILVSGGSLTGETKQAIQDHIDNQVKGRGNFHAILVIEADSNSPSVSGMSGENRTKIEMKSLTEAQHDDALFQNYEEQSGDKVGMQFRLPRMLRGIDRGYNRSTSESALLFAEQQVFGPERDEFDFIVNRRLLTAELNIRFFEFRSNPPGNMAPEVMAKIIRDLTNASVLTPAEARNFAEHVFGETLRRIDEPWTQQPINLTIAGMGQDSAADGAEPDEPPDPENEDAEDASTGDEDTAAKPKRPIKKLPTPPERGPARKRSRVARELIALHNDMMKRERASHLLRAHKDRVDGDARDNPL